MSRLGSGDFNRVTQDGGLPPGKDLGAPSGADLGLNNMSLANSSHLTAGYDEKDSTVEHQAVPSLPSRLSIDDARNRFSGMLKDLPQSHVEPDYIRAEASSLLDAQAAGPRSWLPRLLSGLTGRRNAYGFMRDEGEKVLVEAGIHGNGSLDAADLRKLSKENLWRYANGLDDAGSSSALTTELTRRGLGDLSSFRERVPARVQKEQLSGRSSEDESSPESLRGQIEESAKGPRGLWRSFAGFVTGGRTKQAELRDAREEAMINSTDYRLSKEQLKLLSNKNLATYIRKTEGNADAIAEAKTRGGFGFKRALGWIGGGKDYQVLRDAMRAATPQGSARTSLLDRFRAMFRTNGSKK